jgi:hypothetical protein
MKFSKTTSSSLPRKRASPVWLLASRALVTGIIVSSTFVTFLQVEVELEPSATSLQQWIQCVCTARHQPLPNTLQCRHHSTAKDTSQQRFWHSSIPNAASSASACHATPAATTARCSLAPRLVRRLLPSPPKILLLVLPHPFCFEYIHLFTRAAGAKTQKRRPR